MDIRGNTIQSYVNEGMDYIEALKKFNSLHSALMMFTVKDEMDDLFYSPWLADFMKKYPNVRVNGY